MKSKEKQARRALDHDAEGSYLLKEQENGRRLSRKNHRLQCSSEKFLAKLRWSLRAMTAY